jgi:AhpD family alkylhydroperoxidase
MTTSTSTSNPTSTLNSTLTGSIDALGAQRRRDAARVPLEVPDTLFGRALAWYSRRTYGDVLDNGLALLHNRPILMAVLRFEQRVDKWRRLDADLKTLAVMASASVIGCSWCMDFGYFAAHSKGLKVDTLKEVPRWRESDAFTPLERAVLEYAEAMTVTPPTVTDEMAAALRSELGDDAFVELTMMVAVENERSRFNSALGLSSQGFSDRCEIAR